jgi:tetratricopeptide (TPR) repeat protein
MRAFRRRQFYRKISEWGFEKNIKDKEMQAIVQNMSLMEGEDGSFIAELRGHQIDPAKIQRWQRSHRGRRDVVRPFLSHPSNGKSSCLLHTVFVLSESPHAVTSSSTVLDATDEREFPIATQGGSIHESINPNPSSTPEISEPSQEAENSKKENLSHWKTVDVLGSPKLSHLFEALMIECDNIIPPLALTSSTSANASLFISETGPEGEVGDALDGEEWIENSAECDPDYPVRYSLSLVQNGAIYSGNSKRSLPKMSSSEWSLLDWSFSQGRPYRMSLGNIHGISPFPTSSGTTLRKTLCDGIFWPSTRPVDFQSEEMEWKRRVGKLKRTLGAGSPQTLVAMSRLGGIYFDQQKSLQAERLYRQVAISSKRIFGLKHVKTLHAYLDVVEAVQERGLILQALKIHQPIHEMIFKFADPVDPLALQSNCIKARLLADMYQLDEAEKLNREMLQISLYTHGPRRESTLEDMLGLAEVLRSTGRLNESEQLLRIVLDINGKMALLSEDAIHWCVQELLDICIKRGQYGESKRLATTLVERSEAVLGPENPNTLWGLFKIGLCSRMQGDLVESENQLRRVLEKQLEKTDERSNLTRRIMQELCFALEDMGRQGEATTLLEKCYKGAAETLGVGNSATFGFCQNLRENYEKLGNYEDALELCKRQVDLARKEVLDTNTDLLWLILRTTRLLRKTGRCAEAIIHLEDFLRTFAGMYELSDPLIVCACDGLGLCYEKVGRYDEAFDLYQQFYAQIRSKEGDEHPAAMKVSRWIMRFQRFLIRRSEDILEKPINLGNEEPSSSNEGSIGEDALQDDQWTGEEMIPVEEDWMNYVFDFDLLANGSCDDMVSDGQPAQEQR